MASNNSLTTVLDSAQANVDDALALVEAGLDWQAIKLLKFASLQIAYMRKVTAREPGVLDAAVQLQKDLAAVEESC